MKAFVALFFCLCFAQTSIGQTYISDKNSIDTHIQNEQEARIESTRHIIHFRMTYNPIKLVLFVPLYLYQKFISEQVSAVCEFEPSCSNFGLQAISQLGFIKGLFFTADRLTRCNGNAQTETKYYLIDHNSGKVIDEPIMYKTRN